MSKYVLLFACLLTIACSDERDSPLESDAGSSATPMGSVVDPATTSDAGTLAPVRGYVVGSGLSTPDQTSTTYVAVVPTLEQPIDYSRVREVSGWGDVWVWNGKVFIAEGESPVIARYGVAADLSLVEEGRLSFAGVGLSTAQFWNAIWISPTKAYMANGQGEYVIWNPSTLEITGRMPHAPVGERPGLRTRLGTTDRGTIVRNGRLYHPYNWTNEDYAKFAPDSKIAIYDVQTDTLLRVVDAPCPGLDLATVDEAGNMFFSNWTGIAGVALIDPVAPCGVRIAADGDGVDPTWTTAWTQLTAGRQGAALRYAGDGFALLSVLHHERLTITPTSDPFDLVDGENWRIWKVDLSTKLATPIEEIVWNSGATYVTTLSDATYVMVPSADYRSSQAYAIQNGAVRPSFSTRGWGIRLFELR